MFDYEFMHVGTLGNITVQLEPAPVVKRSFRREYVVEMWRLIVIDSGVAKEHRPCGIARVSEKIQQIAPINDFVWENFAPVDYRLWHGEEVENCVYFIEAVGCGRVKIGKANSLSGRIDLLMPGCPFPMKVLLTVPGGYDVEVQMRDRFRHLHAHNEWHFLKDDLKDFIEGHEDYYGKQGKPIGRHNIYTETIVANHQDRQSG